MINKTKVTSKEKLDIYLATNAVFLGLIKEIRELSKKKPDAVMSKGKVKIINRVLVDLKDALKEEPEAKFLDLLDDEELPQMSDAVIVMVQFESALQTYKDRYYQSFRRKDGRRSSVWVTPEFLSKYDEIEDY